MTGIARYVIISNFQWGEVQYLCCMFFNVNVITFKKAVQRYLHTKRRIDQLKPQFTKWNPNLLLSV